MNMARTNRVLTFCWREWRAQRNVLLAYTGMGLAALYLVFLLMPEHWWQEDGRVALTLSWFVVLGFVGVIAFATPALVRSEFGGKHDHFVRRLPGALLPSFGGKLLFLVLTAVALPLVCLGAGQLFLLAIDEPWHDLFVSTWNGDVALRWPWPVLAIAPVSLLIPWVWAVGSWLPGGRMAIGGTALLVLVLGIGVFAVLRQSPDIEKGIAWESWLWTVPVIGLAVAAMSWTQGRRGGGPLRSARFGLTAAAIGFVPPAVWLAGRVWDYHHPDLQNVANLSVTGLSPDHRFALATASAHEAFRSVLMRVDLQTGSAEQLQGINYSVEAELQPPFPFGLAGRFRYWRIDDYDAWAERIVGRSVLDLQTGERSACGWNRETNAPVLTDTIEPLVSAERRARTPLRAPDDVRVWFEGHDLVFASPDGREERLAWQGPLPACIHPIGHGLLGLMRKGDPILFDLTTRVPVTTLKRQRGVIANDVFVRGIVFSSQEGGRRGEWWRSDRSAPPVRVDALQNSDVIGLLDDDHLLCRTCRARTTTQLFLLRVADGARIDLALPKGTPSGCGIEVCAPLHQRESLLCRDPAGRVWLRATNATDEAFLCIDTASREVAVALPHVRLDPTGTRRLLGWPDVATAQFCEGNRIVRVDIATGERTVLFPRR